MDGRRKERILIADDSWRNRMELEGQLKSDFDIIEAENGREAIELLRIRRTEIDLVLLDIAMPERDGFDVLVEMSRQKWLADTPVIIIMDDGRSGQRLHGIRLPAGRGGLHRPPLHAQRSHSPHPECSCAPRKKGAYAGAGDGRGVP